MGMKKKVISATDTTHAFLQRSNITRITEVLSKLLSQNGIPNKVPEKLVLEFLSNIILSQTGKVYQDDKVVLRFNQVGHSPIDFHMDLTKKRLYMNDGAEPYSVFKEFQLVTDSQPDSPIEIARLQVISEGKQFGLIDFITQQKRLNSFGEAVRMSLNSLMAIGTFSLSENGEMTHLRNMPGYISIKHLNFLIREGGCLLTSSGLDKKPIVDTLDLSKRRLCSIEEEKFFNNNKILIHYSSSIGEGIQKNFEISSEHIASMILMDIRARRNVLHLCIEFDPDVGQYIAHVIKFHPHAAIKALRLEEGFLDINWDALVRLAKNISESPDGYFIHERIALNPEPDKIFNESIVSFLDPLDMGLTPLFNQCADIALNGTQIKIAQEQLAVLETSLKCVQRLALEYQDFQIRFLIENIMLMINELNASLKKSQSISSLQLKTLEQFLAFLYRASSVTFPDRWLDELRNEKGGITTRFSSEKEPLSQTLYLKQGRIQSDIRYALLQSWLALDVLFLLGNQESELEFLKGSELVKGLILQFEKLSDEIRYVMNDEDIKQQYHYVLPNYEKATQIGENIQSYLGYFQGQLRFGQQEKRLLAHMIQLISILVEPSHNYDIYHNFLCAGWNSVAERIGELFTMIGLDDRKDCQKMLSGCDIPSLPDSKIKDLVKIPDNWMAESQLSGIRQKVITIASFLKENNIEVASLGILFDEAVSGQLECSVAYRDTFMQIKEKVHKQIQELFSEIKQLHNEKQSKLFRKEYFYRINQLSAQATLDERLCLNVMQLMMLFAYREQYFAINRRTIGVHLNQILKSIESRLFNPYLIRQNYQLVISKDPAEVMRGLQSKDTYVVFLSIQMVSQFYKEVGDSKETLEKIIPFLYSCLEHYDLRIPAMDALGLLFLGKGMGNLLKMIGATQPLKGFEGQRERVDLVAIIDKMNRLARSTDRSVSIPASLALERIGDVRALEPLLNFWVKQKSFPELTRLIQGLMEKMTSQNLLTLLKKIPNISDKTEELLTELQLIEVLRTASKDEMFFFLEHFSMDNLVMFRDIFDDNRMKERAGWINELIKKRRDQEPMVKDAPEGKDFVNTQYTVHSSWPDETPWGILGLAKTREEAGYVTKSQAKKAYRQLVLKYHTDRNKDDKATELMMKKINWAYEMLFSD